jgi:hypothetical protein
MNASRFEKTDKHSRRKTIVMFAVLGTWVVSSAPSYGALCANRRGALSIQEICPASMRVVDASELGGERSASGGTTYSGSIDAIELGSWNGYAKLTELSIPQPGSYTVTAKATVDGMAPNAESMVLCELYPVPNGQAHADAVEQSLLSGAGPALNTIAFTFVHTFSAAGKVELSCMTDSYIALRYLQITAVLTSQISETALPNLVQ